MAKRSADDEAALHNFLNRARVELFPNLKESTVVMSFLTGSVDPKMALELGAAILLNKPLIFLVKKGTVVHERLKMLADDWIEYEDLKDPVVQAKIAAALQRRLKKSR